MSHTQQTTEGGEKTGEDETTQIETREPEVLIDMTSSYVDAKQKFDIVAVHGLYGPSKKTWSSEKHSSWLKQLAITKGWEARVIKYGYNTENMARSFYTRKAISREALRLLQILVELRAGQNPPLPLAFFAHDLGGTIVKEALVLAGQYGNVYANIRCSTRVLMFFGCPHRWTSFHHMETNVARFLLAGSEPKGTAQDAKYLATSIIAVNNSFLQTRMLTRASIINAFSVEEKLRDQVFDISTTSFHTPLEMRVEIKRPHIDLDHEPEGDKFYGIAGRAMNRVTSFPWLHDEISPFIEAIESQASTVYPLKTTLGPGHKFSWLGQNEVFQKWRNHRGPYFLHIHGSLGTSEAAEFAFQELEAGRDKSNFNAILYFKFDRHDIHHNSIGAMANTFLSQIFSQCRESPASLIGDLEPPDFRQCWTDKDAFFFLNKVRTDLGNMSQAIWILDGLDQCDESRYWILSEILGIATRSEQYFKVLITSFDDKHILEALSEFPAINLKEHVKTTDPAVGNPSDPDFALVSELLQDRPQFCYIESEVRDLVGSCSNDDQLRRLLLAWLRVTRAVTTKRAMKQEIRMLSPPTPRKVFERILETVTEDRRPWARKVIMWVLCCVRPLTSEELEMALTLDGTWEESTLESIAHLDIMWEINEYIGPLFIVENGKVQFGHPSGREIFSPENAPLEEDRPWYVLDAPEGSHRRVVKICLRYLALSSVQDQIVAACKASPNTQPILEGQSDLLSYAIQFWPQHYRLGYSTVPAVQVTENVSNFLHDRKVLQYWTAAKWYFSNPYIRSDRSFLSPLPILASLGLEKLVIDLIKGQRPERDKFVTMALTEAARHGQRAVVKTLIKASSINQSGYLEAIEVAARSGELDILGDLLNHATTEFKEIQLPDMLTSRLAFLGLDDLLKSLLEAGTDANPPAQSNCSPPLHCAVMRNNTDTVDILLKYGADSTVPNTNWKNYSPMLVAAKFGHAAMVKRLVEAGAFVKDQHSTKSTAIWLATLLGQHEALRAIIDAGADKRSVDMTLTEELGWPVFLSTARIPFRKCLRSLLRYGVNPNTKTSKSYPTNALSWAAFEGHADICRLLLESGADLEGSDDDRPIIQAVRSRKREVLDVFIEKGANFDAIAEMKNNACTPLIAAAELNLKDFASLLLEKGAGVDYALQSGETALFRAIKSGHAEMAKLLIDAGADITKKAYEIDRSPLHMAYNQAECIKVLLNAGADIEAVCKEGTVLCLATYRGRLEEVKLLVSRHANLEIRYPEQGYWEDDYTPLQVAATIGYTEILRTLIEGGANIRAKASKDATPLILAVLNYKEECLKAILEYNPDLEAVDKDGNTALHFIGSTPPLSIVKLLVNRGANLEHYDQQGYTVLSRAVFFENVPLVEYLIEKKANINAVGGYRGGPLHIAANVNNMQILKLLVEKGGDVNLVDPKFCGTSLQGAFYYKADNAIIRYLVEEAGADVNAHGGCFGSALNVSFLSGSLDMIKLILDKGADVDWADNLDRRPIHYASFKTLNHVQLLLHSGADVTAKNKIGQMPLHIAVVTGRVDVVELILSHTRKYINEPDLDGWTPLLWACRLCDQWGTALTIKVSVIKLLLSHGASLWDRGHSLGREWSPLKLAKYHGASDEVIKLLTPEANKRINKKGKEEIWDAQFHTSRRASRTPGFCNVCLFGIYGTFHDCLECMGPFYLCFKCYSRKGDFHSYHDKWKLCGTEYEKADEEEWVKEAGSSETPLSLVSKVEDEDSDSDWSDDDDT